MSVQIDEQIGAVIESMNEYECGGVGEPCINGQTDGIIKIVQTWVAYSR